MILFSLKNTNILTVFHSAGGMAGRVKMVWNPEQDERAGGWWLIVDPGEILQSAPTLQTDQTSKLNPAWTVKKTVIGTLGLSFPLLCWQRHYSRQDVS